jgi:phosphatidylserine decarboxylase
VTLPVWTTASAVVLVVMFGWWRFYFFHRNPTRTILPGTDPVSAADGQILYVDEVDMAPAGCDGYFGRVQEVFEIAGRWRVVATYLGILDVHVVRAPIAGTVRIRHMEPIGANKSMGASFLFAAAARPLPLARRGYLHKNEFLGVEINGDARMLVVLMADWWIDQIVMFIQDGQAVTRGQVIGKIQMGSQVDVWGIARHFVTTRNVGERVRAGETQLGTLV